MNSLALFVAAASLGVDFGWQHTADGRLEYLIQIEPSLVRSLENGVDITSDLLPEVRGVRRFRISVGTKALPREAIVQASAQEPTRPDATANAKPGPLDKPRVGNDPPWDRPREEPNHVEPNDGRPIEQAAAKLTGDGAGGESPSTEMNRLAADDNETPTASVAEEPSTSPWLVGAIVALCASLGANFYQGWNLKSARRRYYQLVDRLGLRPTPGSDGVSIEGYSR